METDTQIILNSNNYKQSNKKNQSSLNLIKILLLISLIVIIALFIEGTIFFISLKNTLSQKILNLENAIKNEEQLVNKQEEIIKKQEEIIKKQDETIRNQEELKKKQDDTIKNQEELKKKQDDTIKNQEELKKKQDETIKNQEDLKNKQNDTIKNQEELINKQDETIKNQKELKNKQDKTIKNQEKLINKQDETIKHQEELINKQDEAIKNQEELKKKQYDTIKNQKELKKKQDETIKNQEELINKQEEEIKKVNYKYSKLYNKISSTNNLDKNLSSTNNLDKNLSSTNDLDKNLSSTNNLDKNSSSTNNLDKNSSSKNNLDKNFSQILYDKYLEEQKYFCDYKNVTNNTEYENEIKIANVDFKNTTFDMYVYNGSDEVSNSIIKSKNWDREDTNKILDAFDFYKNKTKTKNEELFILDIGSSIGWYSYFLGKIGYKIISFEPSERNYYILRKTYCLNNDVNITIINKAFFKDEKKCYYYENNENKRKGKVICKKRNDLPENLEKKGLVTLTKLNHYASYFSDKKVVFMKISVEGAEEFVILDGIEFITKIHIPFIYLEFVSENLNFYGVDKRKFLEIFEENGYKISTTSFLDKNYTSINDIINQNDLVKLFIVNTTILDKI